MLNIVNWTAKEICHFCQRPHVKIQPIKINNFVHRYAAIPLNNHMAKASDDLYNKEETGMNSNLITESKVREYNRMSLNSHTEINVTGSAGRIWTGLCQTSCPEDASKMSEMCPGMRKTHYSKVMIVNS